MEEKNSEKKERKMRDSGIPWIGEVPDGWKVGRIKDIIDVLTDFTANGSFADLAKNVKYIDDEDYARLIRLTDLRDNLNNAGVFVNENSYSYLSKSKLFGGEILVANVGAYAGLFCEMPMINKPATLGPNMFLLKPNKKMLSRYLYYIGISPLVCGQLTVKATSSAQPKLNKTDIKTTYILIPPLDMQQKLVYFLDSKCSEIDTLIENLRVRIESVKEYKKAVITEAVTKGLDKDAKMKDSGVEWIGEIPEGWKVVRFKHIASIKSNLVQPDKYMKYPQVAPDNIEKDTGRLLSHQTVEESGIISGNHLFYRGQILYSKIRPNLNKLTVAPFDGLCSADMYPIESKLPTLFMVYLMLSTYFVSQVSLIIQDRVKMPKINQEELGEIKVVVPSQQDMLTIADYLDSKCSEIDALLQNYEAQITTLEKYKKSLIYEYVTGKKEVPTA